MQINSFSYNFSIKKFNRFESDKEPNPKKNNLADKKALRVRRKLEDIQMAKELGIDLDDLT